MHNPRGSPAQFARSTCSIRAVNMLILMRNIHDWGELYQSAQNLVPFYDYIEDFPHMLKNMDIYNKVYQDTLQKKFNTWQYRQCTYIYGDSRTGKTSHVYNKHGNDLFRAADGKNPFDNYNNQPVMLLDEYRATLPFSQFLQISDGYPYMLPCRFNNKLSCHSHLYIVSNIPPSAQPYGELYDKNNKNAFMNRFSAVLCFTGLNKYSIMQATDKSDYYEEYLQQQKLINFPKAVFQEDNAEQTNWKPSATGDFSYYLFDEVSL